MKFKIGQIEVHIFDADIANGHIRLSVNFPIADHRIFIAGEYEKDGNKPFYVSVELDKEGDKDHAEESAK